MMLKYLIQTSIFRYSKNYGSLTHETRIKDAVNMGDLICLLATVRTLKSLELRYAYHIQRFEQYARLLNSGTMHKLWTGKEIDQTLLQFFRLCDRNIVPKILLSIFASWKHVNLLILTVQFDCPSWLKNMLKLYWYTSSISS